MPYIVKTTRSCVDCDGVGSPLAPDGHGHLADIACSACEGASVIVSRRAIATVEEASEAVVEACAAGIEADVEEVSWLDLVQAAGPVRLAVEPGDGVEGSRAKILAAYNAKQGS